MSCLTGFMNTAHATGDLGKVNTITTNRFGLQEMDVCIEGNIGSGKTTFLQHFQDLRPILEAHLYSDPKRWSFTFQSLVTLTLLKKHDHPQTKPLRVMERSLYSATYCFIENLKNSGLLADVEYNVLTGWFDFLLKQGRVSVDLIVYLQTSPQTCFERIQTRNRPEERNITLSRDEKRPLVDSLDVLS
ncbi:DNK-like protein [Mya arenaria]|uniref:DNK-like protein n=1 Tax=Mya arenaria TaxID=6604 RepID=A0ABY7G0D3_MYAAR|nr:DNK-like protein [Mya arenaria]